MLCQLVEKDAGAWSAVMVPCQTRLQGWSQLMPPPQPRDSNDPRDRREASCSGHLTLKLRLRGYNATEPDLFLC